MPTLLLRLTIATLLLFSLIGTSIVSHAAPTVLLARRDSLLPRAPKLSKPAGVPAIKPSPPRTSSKSTTKSPGPTVPKATPVKPSPVTKTPKPTPPPKSTKTSSIAKPTGHSSSSVATKPSSTPKPTKLSSSLSSGTVKPTKTSLGHSSTTASPSSTASAAVCHQARSLNDGGLESRDVDNSIIEAVNAWAKVQANIEKIKAAQALKGGWEGWAQVELALYFQNFKGKKWVVSREGSYQNSANRWDIRVDRPEVKSNVPPDIIELKCQKVGETSDQLWDRVKADAIKITEKEALPNNSKVWVLALGLKVATCPPDMGVKGLDLTSVDLGPDMMLWWGTTMTARV